MTLSINDAVFQELKAVAESGITNMFDIEAVAALARGWDYDALAEFIDNNPSADYCKLVFGDFEVSS